MSAPYISFGENQLERIQKILSARGVCSRRKAEVLIEEGHVTVDGIPAALGTKADPSTQEICVYGKAITAEQADFTYILLHKPKGYLSTVTDDRGRKTVMDLLGEVGQGLWPVGRLDLDSQGLLLLTNDGALTQKLTHPSFGVEKTYEVKVRGENIEQAVLGLGGELTLDGEILNPAKVQLLSKQSADTALLEITINQGKNRQVRRMCALFDLNVLSLTRVREGNLQLGALNAGKWRHLLAEEARYLQEI